MLWIPEEDGLEAFLNLESDYHKACFRKGDMTSLKAASNLDSEYRAARSLAAFAILIRSSLDIVTT